MPFGERLSQLCLFCEYVFAPGKSPVEVQPEILDVFLLRKVYIIYVDWGGAGFFRVLNVTWTGSDSFAFVLRFFSHF
jgi:hypothetical protein